MSASREPRVAVLGATGLVGRALLRQLEEREFPVGELVPLASSARGRTVEFRGHAVPVREAGPASFEGIDLVLASAGGATSRALLPHAVEAGAVCVDNTSAFRLDPDVPLVVPEVNGHRLDDVRLGEGAIVANPNCSTIQLVAALKPLHDAARVERVVCSTYQSMSGAGAQALERFESACRALLDGATELPADLEGTAALDVVPDIGGLGEHGSSVEEEKMVAETPKILEADVALDVHCVRVPVAVGHAESVLVETAFPLSVEEARERLAAAPGLAVEGARDYTTPRAVAGDGRVHVGRLRASRTAPNGLLLWVVADNLLKGAALNAVQIAEEVVRGSRERASRAVSSGARA